MSSDLPIAIVSAMVQELAPLVARLGRPEVGRVGGMRVRRGELQGRRVCLAVSGEGSRNAAAAVERLLAGAPVEALLGIGIAGGLTGDLGVGDLVLSDRLLQPGGPVVEPPPWRWSKAVRRFEDEPGGTVVTVQKIVRTPSDKRRLASSLGLERRSVVDLESTSWASAAADRGVPWLVLRSVSDSVGETLPLDFDRFRRPDGRVSRARVIAHAAPRPKLLIELARLRRRIGACASALADATERLLA